MKHYLLCAALAITAVFSSCMFSGERIDGNGNTKSETRNVTNTSKIKVQGDVDVLLQSGPAAVRVEADENLIPYIETRVEGGWLTVKTKDNANLNSSNPITVYITTPDISDLSVSGSGNITGNSKFSLNNDMSFQVTGSGDITVAVNAPKIEASITGSGNLHLTGETKDIDIHITGSGNYDGPDLKAENAEVSVTGSGDASLYADAHLEASIMGSGNVKYRGNATVDTHVTGSGTVNKIQ